MKEKQIIDKVKDCLVEVLGIEKTEISDDSSIVDDLGAESLDLLDLVFRLEQTFKIRITRGEIEKRARESLGAEEFENNGILSAEALKNLRSQMPEVQPGKFTPGLRANEIPRLFTVRTFACLIKYKLEEKKSDIEK